MTTTKRQAPKPSFPEDAYPRGYRFQLDEAAAILGVAEATLRSQIRNGRFAAAWDDVRRRRLTTRAEIKRYRKKHKMEAD